jgi:hypothetical protein
MRPFTPEEDAQLIELRLAHPGSTGAPKKHEQGRGGLRVIAAKMNRPYGSVWYRLRKLAELEDAEDERNHTVHQSRKLRLHG